MNQATGSSKPRQLFSLKQINGWLSDRRTFGFPLAIFALIWPVISGLGGQMPTGGYLAISIHLYDFLGAAAACTGVLVARLALRLTNYRWHTPLATFLIFYVISLVAAVFQYWAAASFGPIADLFAYTIPITAVVGLGLLLSFTLVQRSITDLREATYQSKEHKQKLEFLQTNLDQQLDANRTKVLYQVQQVIIPAIQRIQEALTSEEDNQKISQGLKQIVDKEIRPLSTALLEEKPEGEYVPPELDVDSKKSRSLLEILGQRIPIRSVFALPIFSLCTVVFVLPGYWAIYGPSEAFVPATISLVVTWLFWLLAGKLTGKRELAFMWLIPVSMVAALGAAVVFAEANILLGQAASFEFNLLHTVNVAVIALANALFSSIQAVRWAKLQVVANNNLATELLIARLRQDLWLNRRRLAKLVHGAAQTRLQVAILILQKPDSSAGDRLEAAKTIEAIVKELFDPSASQLRLGQSFSDLQRLWQGVCDVSIEIDQELLASIESDESASGALDEFVREAVTNAVKHSKAKKVLVQIDGDEEESVSVLVRNPLPEGEVRLASGSKGMGSQIYSAVTVSWSLTKDENDVILQGVVPLAAKNKA